MRCPGQDTRYWKEDAIFEINCPFCGEEIEFFKDDPTRRCPGCGKVIPNPRLDFGCAAYCKFASQCLGNLPPELVKKRGELFKEKLVLILKEMLKDSPELLKKILTTAQKVENLVKNSKSSGLSVLLVFFYFLEPKQREELFKKADLPETLVKEIKKALSKLPPSPAEKDFLVF